MQNTYWLKVNQQANSLLKKKEGDVNSFMLVNQPLRKKNNVRFLESG